MSLDARLGLGGSWIEIRDLRTGQRQHFNTTPKMIGAHGGGDEGLLRAFVQRLRDGRIDQSHQMAEEILIAHRLAFAAEDARLGNKIIEFTSTN
jgi:hypothetical protein